MRFTSSGAFARKKCGQFPEDGYRVGKADIPLQLVNRGGIFVERIRFRRCGKALTLVARKNRVIEILELLIEVFDLLFLGNRQAGAQLLPALGVNPTVDGDACHADTLGNLLLRQAFADVESLCVVFSLLFGEVCHS